MVARIDSSTTFLLAGHIHAVELEDQIRGHERPDPPDPPVIRDGTITGHALNHGGAKDTGGVDAGTGEGKKHHVDGGHGDAHNVDSHMILMDLMPDEEHEESSQELQEKAVASLQVCVKRGRSQREGVGTKGRPDEGRGEDTAKKLASPEPEHAHERDVTVKPAVEADRWVHVAAHGVVKGGPGHAKGKGNGPKLQIATSGMIWCSADGVRKNWHIILDTREPELVAIKM